MKNSFKLIPPLYLHTLIIVMICVSCSKLGQEITPLNEIKPDPIIGARTGIDYDDWVDQVNIIKEDYFGSEDISELEFDYFYDKYLEVNPMANPTDNVLKAEMKRTFLSVEYVSLEDNLRANPLIEDAGETALLALKADVLTMMGTNETYEDIQTFLQTTAEDALEDESLNVAEQGIIFLSCVGIETALNPELEWSSATNPGSNSKSRLACNFDDIALDFILIAVGASVLHNAITALGGYEDFIRTIINGDFSGLTITALISLQSPALPFIVMASAAASILINCWEVIADFFVDLFDSVRDFIVNIFGGSADCEAPDNISARALDCSSDQILFTAGLAGDDIVAYMWNNTNTIPQDITTQARSFAFEPTNNNVTIRVTGICSDGETVVQQVVEPFDITDLIDEDPPTEVIFQQWPTSPTIGPQYTFYIYTGAGVNETLSWTGDFGTSIGVTGPTWAVVTFFGSPGNRDVRATITDNCNELFSTNVKSVTVN